ncbi:MAG: cyclopropane-fatty-acyl-phospholipid synthase [Acidobacteria bacterium]|nr:cyclopropane-fatty-acyl-phospholipid synthase [Acidobacteriota bacterium]
MTDAIWKWALNAAEKGQLPDGLIRWGIRRLCRERLNEEAERHDASQFVEKMRRGPVAPVPDKANEQHYEVPAAFFKKVLGPNLKYSCCYWDADTKTLADAERKSIEITCLRARIEDGHDILELGCGWGSLSLWMAEHYPSSRIVAVSNSASQREFIMTRACERGLRNLEVVTQDMNDFDTPRRFDRIVSLEMFEHMRNYRELLRRASTWMKPDAKMLVHIFCHRDYAYEFETEGSTHWMGQHFFTGGIMPSRDLLLRFQEDIRLLRTWTWGGAHYEQTARAWLKNMDAHREELLPILVKCYGRDEAERWFQRWRIFFLACEELWGFDDGQQWIVAHYLLESQPARTFKTQPTARNVELVAAA